MPIRRGRNVPVTLTLSYFMKGLNVGEPVTGVKTRDATASKKTVHF